MKSRVLFVCKQRSDENKSYSNGNSVGLINSSSFVVNYLESIHIEAKLAIAIDANCIDKEVTSYKPTHVIIEAIWVTPEKIDELLKLEKNKNIKWIIRLHSKISFIANEGIAFNWIVGYTKLMQAHKNLYISANNLEFSKDLHKIYSTRSVFLPNIYSPEREEHKKPNYHKDHIDIASFGAIRPMKNQLTQAVAAIRYGDETNQVVHFHINSDRIEQQGDNVYKNLKALFEGTKKHKLVGHN